MKPQLVLFCNPCGVSIHDLRRKVEPRPASQRPRRRGTDRAVKASGRKVSTADDLRPVSSSSLR